MILKSCVSTLLSQIGYPRPRYLELDRALEVILRKPGNNHFPCTLGCEYRILGGKKARCLTFVPGDLEELPLATVIAGVSRSDRNDAFLVLNPLAASWLISNNKAILKASPPLSIASDTSRSTRSSDAVTLRSTKAWARPSALAKVEPLDKMLPGQGIERPRPSLDREPVVLQIELIDPKTDDLFPRERVHAGEKDDESMIAAVHQVKK